MSANIADSTRHYLLTGRGIDPATATATLAVQDGALVLLAWDESVLGAAPDAAEIETARATAEAGGYDVRPVAERIKAATDAATAHVQGYYADVTTARLQSIYADTRASAATRDMVRAVNDWGDGIWGAVNAYGHGLMTGGNPAFPTFAPPPFMQNQIFASWSADKAA